MLERLDEGAGPLLALCSQLKAAERVSLNQFVKDTHRSVETLQWLLAASVVLLVILGFTATRLIYRARIAPLRAQVIQSRALLERQEKLASLGTLSAGIAHEIRNPLTAINVRVHGLKKALPAGSSEQEDVTVIDEEIRRLDQIVRDFLDFARPSEPRLVTIAIESLFNRVESLLLPAWQRTSIRLRVMPPPPLCVRADPHQLEQVLINLVQNAADSIEGEGQVTLRARTENMRLSGPVLPAVILQVVDTGKGIPPEVQMRVFDPFFTTKEGGTGLGLAIAASIVEKHGGVLQFQTRVGSGTTFEIALPPAGEPHEDLTT
jgi:signal transduction histidine kinase